MGTIYKPSDEALTFYARMYKGGFSYDELAAKYGCSTTSMSRFLHGLFCRKGEVWYDRLKPINHQNRNQKLFPDDCKEWVEEQKPVPIKGSFVVDEAPKENVVFHIAEHRAEDDRELAWTDCTMRRKLCRFIAKATIPGNKAVNARLKRVRELRNAV